MPGGLLIDEEDDILPAIAFATGMTLDDVEEIIRRRRGEGHDWESTFEHFKKLAAVRGHTLHVVDDRAS